jgi:hypothetical protein
MKTTILWTAPFAVACIGAFASCGGSSDAGAVVGGDDGGAANGDSSTGGGDSGITGGDSGSSGEGGADSAVDAAPGMYGAPSTTYPAFTPFTGELINNGGGVLATPKIVTVTWPNDGDVALLEDFDDKIGGTAYWQAAVSEYGVGAATSGAANHIHITTPPPAQMTDQDIVDFITTNAGGALPAPTTQTIYMIYLHPNTSLIFGGSAACTNGIGGYHNGATVQGVQTAYAVVPRCGSVATATSAASHEIGEASTDPQPNAQPGYVGFTDATIVYDLWQRGNDENGDACEFYPDSFYVEQAPFGYTVQRLWSNKAGPLGHSPCQPHSGTYFSATPLELQDIVVDLSQQGGSATTMTKGYHATLGQTITFPVGFYSDAATTGPWTLAAAESNPLVSPVTGRIVVHVDPAKTSGVNGEKTYVTVKVNVVGPAKAEMLTLVSTMGGVSHYMPVLIGSE